MKRNASNATAVVLLLFIVGCASRDYVPQTATQQLPPSSSLKSPTGEIQQTNFQQNNPTVSAAETKPSANPVVTPGSIQLDDLVRTAIGQNPRLARATFAVIGSVRAAFYDLYALERRLAILDELAKLAADAVKNGQTLFDNKQIARLDLIQLEVEQARFRSQAESTRRELPGARARLAAAVGNPRLEIGTIAGPYEDVPKYDADRVLETVLATHPDIRSARVAVDRAHVAVHRAEVEWIPNVTLSSGYVRQNQNKSDDFLLGVSAPIPVWNRNQGNIRAARAERGGDGGARCRPGRK